MGTTRVKEVACLPAGPETQARIEAEVSRNSLTRPPHFWEEEKLAFPRLTCSLPQDSMPVVDQQLLYTCCPYIGEHTLPRGSLVLGLPLHENPKGTPWAQHPRTLFCA